MALLKTKLMNSVYKYVLRDVLDVTVKNVTLGCSGHITNKLSGLCVYVDTRAVYNQSLGGKALLRYALDDKDFSSISLGGLGRNHFIPHPLLGRTIAEFLTDEKMVIAINSYRKSKGL